MDVSWKKLEKAVDVNVGDILREALNPESDSFTDYQIIAIDSQDIVLKNDAGIRRVLIRELPIMHLFFQTT